MIQEANWVCDKCGEQVKRGLEYLLEHQFQTCKAHYTVTPEHEGSLDFSVKVMPFVYPKKEDVLLQTNPSEKNAIKIP